MMEEWDKEFLTQLFSLQTQNVIIKTGDEPMNPFHTAEITTW